MLAIPMVFAFGIALVGALAIGVEASWTAVLAGATLTAAIAGFAAAVLQFLPQRLFAWWTLAAGVATAWIVWALLPAYGAILGFGPVSASMVLVWPVALVSAVLGARALGGRLPPIRRRQRPAVAGRARMDDGPQREARR